MTIESNNRSGELVPSDEVTSLIQYSLQQLGLNADCEVSLTFVDEAEMTELHIKWMDFRWICQRVWEMQQLWAIS
jgi:probable rRNA maturation factor